MNASTSHSSTVLIFLEVHGRKIRLSSVAQTWARLYESAFQVSPGTHATLILSIDGKEQRDDVMLETGIEEGASEVKYSFLHERTLLHNETA